MIFNWYDKPVILGSKSPRRKELLHKIGLEFSVVQSPFIESSNDHIKSPVEYAKTTAHDKGRHLIPIIRNGWIITADTIVVLENQIIGKPKSVDESVDMLTLLSGQTHHVYTGVCITNAETEHSVCGVEKTDVTFRPLQPDEIEHYVCNYPTLDKAGAYGIQDFSAVFVERIDGCFYNVVGLPLTLFYHLATAKLESLLHKDG